MDNKIKNLIVVFGGLAVLAFSAYAMPTQMEISEVRPLVQELMREDIAALKTGSKSRQEVAIASMRLADKAESEAAKLLLMKGAFSLYARDGKCQQAIETLEAMKNQFQTFLPLK